MDSSGEMGAERLGPTSDLLRLYLRHAGESSTPAEYHLWTCYSLVAACLGNRVSLDIIREQPLYPNLYVFLVGPSGTGKSSAIATGRKFVDAPEVAPAVGPLSGLKITAEYLVEHMARRSSRGEPALVYLITSEASATLGRGDRADAFVRTVTELFTGREQTIIEGTVGRGTRTVKNYCLNWIAGTTVEWLNDSVRRQDISGGFFARVVTVVSTNSSPATDILYPEDYDEVTGYLVERFRQLVTIYGSFVWGEGAYDAFRRWVEGRPRPMNELMLPSYERQPELVLKAAMCRAVMTDPLNLVIRRNHLADAINHVSLARRGLPVLIARSAESVDTQGIVWLEGTIRAVGKVRQDRLIRWGLQRGIPPKRLVELLAALTISRRVLRIPSPVGPWFVWVGKRMP